MSREISKSARQAFEDATSSEGEIALFVFEHSSLTDPLRICTNPTDRLSDDPLAYGTRSTWQGANPTTDPYLFVLMSAEAPGDQEDATASATIILENVDNRISEVLRSFTDLATVHMAVVLASSPNIVEAEYLNMNLLSADGDAGEVQLTIGRKPLDEEDVPRDRFTKDRFQGLHR